MAGEMIGMNEMTDDEKELLLSWRAVKTHGYGNVTAVAHDGKAQTVGMELKKRFK